MVPTSAVPTSPEASQISVTTHFLLICGILSSLLYVVMNIIVALQWDAYSSYSQTVSELSAVGAPTRLFWVLLSVPYTLLTMAFGLGVRQAANGNRPLRKVGTLLLIYGGLGFVWPLAPMHLREVIAAGGGTFSDTMHIGLGMVTVAIMLLTIGFGAAAFGKGFRWYSILTIILLAFFGALTAVDAPKLESNLPTPWIGLWERINIGVFLLWIIVLAAILLMKNRYR